MSEQVNREIELPKLAISFLPSYSGDGYGYGGGILITCGDIAISVGENNHNDGRRIELAERIVEACNTHSTLLSRIDALRAGLIEAEALLCDERGGPAANELAARIRALLEQRT